jgi:hypothetical protein
MVAVAGAISREEIYVSDRAEDVGDLVVVWDQPDVV